MSPVTFILNGAPVEVPGDGASLLEALRDRLGIRSAKDGCSPQGQCGCCTVWVDGQPRVACVTPVERVAGRAVTTVEGLPAAESWAARLCATGGSQCGFCTPGIVMRLDALTADEDGRRDEGAVRQALLAHMCRCTGWNSVVEAACSSTVADGERVLAAAVRRAGLEGGTPQAVSPEVALGRGGFADDTAPLDALHAVRTATGEWVVAETRTEARRRAGKVQGRRTTESLAWPIDVPSGEWVRTLQTTWVEPAYLEPDAAWCAPDGEPVGPLTNGGAFGGKHHGTTSEVAHAARRLAREHGRTVIATYSREDVVRLGPKRPPLAAGVRADGTGVVRVARTPGIAAAITAVTAGLHVEEVDVVGPPTSVALRAAGWAEASVLLAPPDGWVTAPNGARAHAEVAVDGAITVDVHCGAVLDEVVLRSYCIGAAHMALGWVRHEGIAVGDDGVPRDLTIRSFGVVRAVDTPRIEVTVHDEVSEPVNGSDAVFAAVALALWRHDGFPPRWPTSGWPTMQV